MSVFSVLFAQLTGLIFANEQQIVIHWTSETTSGSSDLLKDRDGNLLNSGSTSNGDGSIVTLGYFDTATTSDPFNGNWVPLTEGTRIGDSSSGYGYADELLVLQLSSPRIQILWKFIQMNQPTTM